MNMKKYEEFCSKCSYYEAEYDECHILMWIFGEMAEKDILHISYSEKDIIKKYQCPYQTEILIKSFNEEKEGNNK